MIDVCGIFNFRNELEDNYANPFAGTYSSDISAYDLKEAKLIPGNIFCLEMKGNSCIYYNKADHIFTFGTICAGKFHNNTGEYRQKVLKPSELYELYVKFDIGMLEYLKGNFTIIIYDDRRKALIIASSKFNTMPLFYYYKDNNFIFSSSVKAMFKFSHVRSNLNEKALVEQALFFYPLADRTYFSDIFQIPSASIFQLDKSGLSIKKYWELENLFRVEKNICEEDALSQCVNLMKENLKVYTSGADKFLLSLTGGFDSRTNLALLDRDSKDFLCYSYGMPGSKQIEIPLLISKKLGLNYKPIYLDREFENSYEKYALKALDFSNGSAPILRANFPYVFEQLSSFSKVNITGLFGSEIIKCFHQANEQVSQETIDLFMNGDFDKNFESSIRRIKKIGYINNSVIDKYSHPIRDDFNNNYIQRLKKFSNIHRFYIFLLEEAIRKYFMQEISIERYYVETITPYLDDDFLELIFKTPFAGIYKGASKRNIFSRRNSQIFYAKLIAKAKPILGGIITDRGYKPKDLLLPFVVRAFKIGPQYLKERIKRNIKGNDTFNSGLWSKNMVKKYIYKTGNSDDIFTDKLIKDFETGFNLRGDFRFFSVFSLRLWLYLLNNKGA